MNSILLKKKFKLWKEKQTTQGYKERKDQITPY